VYLDYFTAMADPQNSMKDELVEDAVHPKKAGYDILGPLAEQAIAESFRAKQTAHDRWLRGGTA
jgi:lysophospholipase L1-like esterase